jgi:hypothetical protein
MARPRHRINRIIRMNESSGDDDAGSGRCCNQASRRTAPAFRESSKDNNRFVFAGGSKFLVSSIHSAQYLTCFE